MTVPKFIPLVAGRGITPEDYAEFSHSEIQSALLNQWRRNQRIDAEEIYYELIAALGREVYPASYLLELTLDFHSARWWHFYATKVCQASYSRLLERQHAEMGREFGNPANRLTSHAGALEKLTGRPCPPCPASKNGEKKL